jgi:hypothetical protein
VADEKNLRKFEASVYAEIATAYSIDTKKVKDLIESYLM